MRIWPAPAPEPAAQARLQVPRDLTLQIDEGFMVALSSLRMSVKNGVILATIRDGAAWDERVAGDLARAAIDALIAELSASAARLSDDSVRAAPSARESRGTASRRERARLERQRDEAARLAARSRTLRGVVERLRIARDDDALVRGLVLRARDDTLNELMQARLIPRAEPLQQTEEEQRAAIAGVKADLQRLLEDRTGY